jgi:hypothetical protein
VACPARIAPGVTDEGDFVLEGFATDLYGDNRDPARPAAMLTITYYLSPANSFMPNVIWSREYRQRVPVAEPSAEALARAWNSALTTILAELARDLAATEMPRP